MKIRSTLTQSEDLRIGQRGQYIPEGALQVRCKKLGIDCWIEKRRKKITDADKLLNGFIGIGIGYELVYGITINGKDHDVGSMPRDLSKFTRGIEIAKELFAKIK